MKELIKLDSYEIHNTLNVLLQDKTTKRNIIWATNSYELQFGDEYDDKKQITIGSLIGLNSVELQPRIFKDLKEQQERTKTRAEVFTPAWVCNKMNNHIDEDWFGRKDVFNIETEQSWITNDEKVAFPKGKSWKNYVDLKRLEITCGEAPYLVSRYDTSTGQIIVPPSHRIGILDRKLRIVNENTDNEDDWFKWVIRAYESTYGYEFQGDNLLIGRINMLLTFADNMNYKWHRQATVKELKKIANVISWNLWQMDGLSGRVPLGDPKEEFEQLTLFDMLEETNETIAESIGAKCIIYDWRKSKAIIFEEIGGVCNMKFDYVIGNPPYQEDSQGDSTGSNPVYHLFYDEVKKVGKYVELITPARFLFNAGKTPKKWNEKMLNDKHFRVQFYEQNPEKVFSKVPITGGVAISNWSQNHVYKPIETFVPYSELRTIIDKVESDENFISIREIIYIHSKFNLDEVYNLNDGYKSLVGSEGRDKRVRANAFDVFDFFTNDRMNSTDIKILGLQNSKRTYKYINCNLIENTEWIGKYKVFVPESNGASGMLGESPARIISKPVIGEVNEGTTQTFIVIGSFDTRNEAENLLKYINSKFARVLLGALKATQRNNSVTWAKVPLQDFSLSSDINWSQSINEIDKQLYKKYGLSQKEIDFIENHVKEME